jgi:4-amino-4-deoxy-L-arabinose transferase-like glycosyltransferase
MACTVLVTSALACVLLSRADGWLPWLRAVVAVAGVAAATLLLVSGRLTTTVARCVAGVAVAACVAAPFAYSVATAATPHTGSIPSVGPSLRGVGQMGPGGLLSAPTPGTGLTAMLSADADDYTWVAAALGSNNAAGYQLATGAPVMAVGGFNGTDPMPTLKEFQDYVADKRIHYFVRGRLMAGQWGGANASGSREAADIAEWVETHFAPMTVDRVIVYDLTESPKNT